MCKRLAGLLRKLAHELDGQEMINVRWHKNNVRAMTRYIEKREALLRVVVCFLDGTMTETELLSWIASLSTTSEARALPEGPTRQRILKLLEGRASAYGGPCSG